RLQRGLLAQAQRQVGKARREFGAAGNALRVRGAGQQRRRRHEMTPAPARPTLRRVYTECPKCRHAPLPADQALPAACPGCGVILAKVDPATAGPLAEPVRVQPRAAGDPDDADSLLLHVPARVDPLLVWGRVGLLVAFAAWS